MPRLLSSHPLAKVRAVHYERLPKSALDWSEDAKVLTDWIYDRLAHPKTAKQATEALTVIAQAPDREPFYELVVLQLESIWASVRIEALRMLQVWPPDGGRFHTGRHNQAFLARDEYHLLESIIRRDESWMVRQEALKALNTVTNRFNDSIVRGARTAAVTDPHWRVRHALLEVFHELHEAKATDDKPWQVQMAGFRSGNELSDFDKWRAQGMAEYFSFVLRRPAPPPPVDENLGERCREPEEHWDFDPSVLAAQLDRCAAGEALDWPKFVSHYLGHPDRRVTRAALRHLVYCDEHQWIPCLRALDDPRHPAAALLRQYTLDEPTELAAAHLILTLDEGTDEGTVIDPDLDSYQGPSVGQLAWALERLLLLEDPTDLVRPWLPLTRCAEIPSRIRSAFTPAVLELAAQLGEMLVDEALAEDATEIRQALVSLAGAQSVVERKAALRALARAPHRLSAEELEALWRRNGQSSRTTEQTLAVSVLMRAPVWENREAAVNQWSQSASFQVRRQVAAELIVRQRNAEQGLPPELTTALDRLQDDPNSLVRAAALTESRARELLAEPQMETSWGVLEMAVRVTRSSLETIEPELPGARRAEVRSTRLPCTPGDQGQRIEFPLDQPAMVSRVGISGHYGLPTDGFVTAVEQGVNLFFWEPGYATMTAFSQGIATGIRNDLHFIGGTFQADAKGIRSDVHRMLKHLKLQRISLFLLFWTRGWSRMTDEVLDQLDRIETDGDVARTSISTHDRPLACQAMRGEMKVPRQWNPLMVRYSAAHRGAEQEVFPLAIETGTSVISFNNTCYGRLLKPLRGSGETPEIRPVDCYRFALSHPAVSVSLSAPANHEQLKENLAALHDPLLPEDRRETLIQHGAEVYEQDRRFQQCVRSR